MRELDCDLAQGFLFAEPVPGEEMKRLFAAKGTLAGPRAGAAAA
jgi:EAL domain-containing protein (putative c-di-GMP-specific phosphodiesterase class I)